MLHIEWRELREAFQDRLELPLLIEPLELMDVRTGAQFRLDYRQSHRCRLLPRSRASTRLSPDLLDHCLPLKLLEQVTQARQASEFTRSATR
jgi:hypothetical protein